MFIHRENALKAHQHNYIILFYTKRALKKILIQNLIKIFTNTHDIAHFSKIFSQGSMPPSMCDKNILIFQGTI